MENSKKNLKVELSKFNESPLSFNEWAEKFNVGKYYTETKKYFQGNPSSGFAPKEPTLMETFKDLFRF